MQMNPKTFCVISCVGESDRAEVLKEVSDALSRLGTTEAIALTNTPRDLSPITSNMVADGTKLAKIRGYAKNLQVKFVCLCDPDVTISDRGVTAVAEEAIATAPEIAYGIIDTQAEETILSGLIAIDKWLSHRVLRPLLWKLGIGITVPGQFLILSPSLLKQLDEKVDSFLDDLYLGLFARLKRMRIVRVAILVGKEESRTTWTSLLTQRIRWMRGFLSLVQNHKANPLALVFLFVHFTAYHLFPVVWLSLLLGGLYSKTALTFFVAVLCTMVVARFSRQRFPVALLFIIGFPLIHLFAIMCWWIPISRQQLTQR